MKVAAAIAVSVAGRSVALITETAVGWTGMDSEGRGGTKLLCTGAPPAEQAANRIIVSKISNSLLFILFTSHLNGFGNLAGEQGLTFRREVDAAVREFLYGGKVPKVEIFPSMPRAALSQ